MCSRNTWLRGIHWTVFGMIPECDQHFVVVFVPAFTW